MTKTTFDTLTSFLEKARKRLSDEEPDAYEAAEDDAGGADEDLTEQDPDEADQWLQENNGSDEASPDAPPDEDADSEAVSEPVAPVQTKAKPPMKRKAGAAVDAPAQQASGEFDPRSEDELQPTKEELMGMREYTRPWEQNARDRDKLEAQAHINPIKHHQGRLVESRNTSHADRQKAYEDFTKQPDYQNADPITQMEMDSKFHEDFHKQNPDHLMNALTSHSEAHKKGEKARELFNQTKDEKIRHIASGGTQGAGTYSAEEGMQHAGQTRDDEDSAPGGIAQDPSAQFASGNQEFLQQYMKDHDKRAKKYDSMTDLENYDPEVRQDIGRVLGDHPALKDAAKKRKVDQFVAKYHPLIGKAAKRVINKLGLQEQAASGKIDHGLLHEAGVHALFQAVNDYDHDHPSKAKFVTHLNRKMHGLMQTALKTQDEIPAGMRQAAKKFDKDRRATNASPVTITNKEGVKTTAPAVPKRSVADIAASHPPEVQDRLKRIVAAKAPIKRQAAAPVAAPPAAPTTGAPKPKMKNVRQVTIDEGGEE